jgi:hypothetical protein
MTRSRTLSMTVSRQSSRPSKHSSKVRLEMPARRSTAASVELRGRLADVPELSVEILHAAFPVLVGFRSGHYRAFLVDLDLERVKDPQAAWWERRVAARGEDRSGSEQGSRWPGCEHFQLRAPIPGSVATYGAVMPSQPLDSLSGEAIAAQREAIEAGARPAALLLGWTKQRTMSDFDGEPNERYLVSVVLDGHHKLAAYAALQTPARALFISRVEDNPGTYEHRSGPLVEITAPLLAADDVS